MSPREVLIKYFGYTAFRSTQEKIINRLMDEKKHCLVLMPTGGGKSI
jgi:ATP-dependent DNA helicase RecQ